MSNVVKIAVDAMGDKIVEVVVYCAYRVWMGWKGHHKFLGHDVVVWFSGEGIVDP